MSRVAFDAHVGCPPLPESSHRPTSRASLQAVGSCLPSWRERAAAAAPAAPALGTAAP
jgi:hypothetical protein